VSEGASQGRAGGETKRSNPKKKRRAGGGGRANCLRGKSRQPSADWVSCKPIYPDARNCSIRVRFKEPPNESTRTAVSVGEKGGRERKARSSIHAVGWVGDVRRTACPTARNLGSRNKWTHRAGCAGRAAPIPADRKASGKSRKQSYDPLTTSTTPATFQGVK